MITPYTMKQAKKFGVTIKVSKDPSKKLDVFKNGVKIASIGAKGYKDYGIYLIEKGKKYANERRRLYRIRHDGEQSKVGSPGYYAWNLLW
jgi:Mn-dependent DtxR family transcriptional regulator